MSDSTGSALRANASTADIEEGNLLPCPFCGEQPSFTDCEKVDDRRYVEKRLRCRDVELSRSLSFGQYKHLTDAQIDHQLRSELRQIWNTRPATRLQADNARLSEALDKILDANTASTPAELEMAAIARAALQQRDQP